MLNKYYVKKAIEMVIDEGLDTEENILGKIDANISREMLTEEEGLAIKDKLVKPIEIEVVEETTE